MHYSVSQTNTTLSPSLSVRQSGELCHKDFRLRIRVTKTLQRIKTSLRSAGNLFPACALKFSQSASAPLSKKMEWAVLCPKYILFSLTLDSKSAQGWGRGLGGVNRL